MRFEREGETRREHRHHPVPVRLHLQFQVPSHCSIKQFQGKKTDRCFTIADVRELSRQADEMGLAHLVITGGEPLVFRDLDELVAAIDPQKFYITSDTNGWLLDLAKAKHLKSLGVDKIQLSLDSLSTAEHNQFRHKKESHERAMRDRRGPGRRPEHHHPNRGDQAARALAGIHRLPRVRQGQGDRHLRHLRQAGLRWEGNFNVLVNRDDMDYVRELEKRYNVFTHLTPSYGLDLGCIAVKRMVSVTKYGDVMPCPYIHTSLGNFFQEPLKDIIEARHEDQVLRQARRYLPDRRGPAVHQRVRGAEHLRQAAAGAVY